ncbi:MAG: hypothetical protein Q8911_08585 [Bacillota bacterium]|nr:hypothetical protein [Bacillota bacterium]
MSDINCNGFPVRGWLNGLIEGSATIDETEETINSFIELAAKKGYSEGVVDGLRRKTSRDEREGVCKASK